MFAEQSLIATLVYKPDCFYLVEDKVNPEMFSNFGDLAKCIWSLVSKDKKVTFSSIEIESKGVIDFETHIKPLGQYVKSKEVESNAKTVRDFWYGNAFTGLATEAMIQIESKHDPLETITDFSSKLIDIQNGLTIDKELTLMEQVLQAQKKIELALESKGMTGIDTGLEKLNEYTGGFQPGGHTVIAGRPGMGKTAIMLDFILHAAKNGVPSAVFSWEMTSSELLLRFASKMTEVSTLKMMNGSMSESETEMVLESLESLSLMPIHIVENPGNISSVRSKYILLNKTKGVQLYAFDYIQRISFKGDIREALTTASRTLANLSKNNNTHNLLLSQLSRSVENRGGSKKPMLSDLKETGAIEEDAKLVIFPYRAEYYGIMEDEEGNSLKGKAELIIAKNREGKTGTIEGLEFIGKTGQFKNEKDLDFEMSTPIADSGMINRGARVNDDLDDIPF